MHTKTRKQSLHKEQPNIQVKKISLRKTYLLENKSRSVWNGLLFIF